MCLSEQQREFFGLLRGAFEDLQDPVLSKSTLISGEAHQFVDPLIAVPVHGAIQLFGNGTRAITLRRDVDWSLMLPYVVPLVPFMVIGYLIADAVPRSGGRTLIGIFALIAVW